jgi:proteasome lid subunit RPN8/RPN11
VTVERLVVAHAARTAIVDHARVGAAETPPVEVCGVLVGEQSTDWDRVTGSRRVANAAADPTTRYELDPETTMATIDDVTDAGDDVVGFYHSHPHGPAEPSATDRELATWTGYVYLVVSLAGVNPAISAWRWTGERFEQLTVERDAPPGEF